MKNLILGLALLPSLAFGSITAAQKYKLNNYFSPTVAQQVQLGTLIENAEAVSTANIAAGAVTSAKMDQNLVRYADITIPTASVLTLNTTPYQLVADPGAGFVTIVHRLYSTLTYNSIAYTCNSAGLIVKYTDGSGTAPGLVLPQAYCQSSATALQVVNASTTAFTPTAHAAIVLHAGTANPASGNSDIKVRVYYSIVPSAL